MDGSVTQVSAEVQHTASLQRATCIALLVKVAEQRQNRDGSQGGGWRETGSLKRAYQQTDEATMLAVVLGAGELRERKA